MHSSSQDRKGHFVENVKETRFDYRKYTNKIVFYTVNSIHKVKRERTNIFWNLYDKSE